MITEFTHLVIRVRGFLLSLIARGVIEQAKWETRRDLGKLFVQRRKRFLGCLQEAGFPPTGIGQIVVGDGDEEKTRFVMACAYGADVLLDENDGLDSKVVIGWLKRSE